MEKGEKINKPAIITIKLPSFSNVSEEKEAKLVESLKN